MNTNDPLPRQPVNSLATKIILFVFASTFVTALVVSWTSIQSTHTHLRERISQRYPVAIERASAELLTWLEGGRADLEELASKGELAASTSRANRALARALARSRHFTGFAVLASDGRVRLSAGDLDPLTREEGALLAEAGQPAVRALPSPDARPALVAVVATPGAARRGRVALVGRYRSDAVASILAQARPEAAGHILLVDAAGRVAAGVGGAPERVPLAALAPAEGIHEYTNDTGLHVVGSARPFGRDGWSIALETPFDVAFEPVLSVVTRVFVIDLCIILLFSYLAYKITTAVVRPIETLSDAARRIAQGQFDLEIPEPHSADEIGLLTRTFNDMMRKLRRSQLQLEAANRNLVDRNAELQQAKEAYEQLSITDGLTKLHNHRFFQDQLTREIKRVSRVQKPLSMLLVDIDDFKRLNDRLGHAAGDELLAGIARIMTESVRESDLLARYGGEEFVVLAADTDIEGAEALAEKVRTAIAETSFILEDSMRPTRVTVSIGVALFKGNRRKFFEGADRALYRAKAEGKNCVVLDSDEEVR